MINMIKSFYRFFEIYASLQLNKKDTNFQDCKIKKAKKTTCILKIF